ncbi:hypothetical protein N9Q05_02465 [bacterium]|nr:hypothetical protein [bacterium]
MKRMMSKREIEIAETIEDLTAYLKFVKSTLSDSRKDLLRNIDYYEDTEDESVLENIKSLKVEVSNLEVDSLALELEIEKLEEEAKTA